VKNRANKKKLKIEQKQEMGYEIPKKKHQKMKKKLKK
jgi:hypothetical protein